MSAVKIQLAQLDAILERFDRKDLLTQQEVVMKKELEERYQELMQELDRNGK